LASGCALPNRGGPTKQDFLFVVGEGISGRRHGDWLALLMGVRLQAGYHGRGGCMLDGGRVWQCYVVREEMDGRNPQVERGIPVTYRNFL
jgi:hypothetical protein